MTPRETPVVDQRGAPASRALRLLNGRGPGAAEILVVPLPSAPEVVLWRGLFWRRIGGTDQPMSDYRRVAGWAAPDFGDA